MFTPVSSLVGGLLIGLAAAALLVVSGRTAGISGVVGGALGRRRGDVAWRLWFLAGLVGGGVVIARLAPATFADARMGSAPLLVAAGLLVGFGTRLGNGCTSGHGVCGLGRLSLRSLVAVMTFMATGAAAVFVARHVFGGGS
jgi:uncharacterized membrane protein YedE/YeeE